MTDAALELRRRERVRLALRQLPNWWQLGRFLTVGASGFAINLTIYALLAHGLALDYLLSAVISNSVALASNFLWNRLWTFKATHEQVMLQAPRFAVVSAIGFVVNLVVLQCGVELLGIAKLPAEVLGSAVAAPVNFLGSRQWALRSQRP